MFLLFDDFEYKQFLIKEITTEQILQLEGTKHDSGFIHANRIKDVNVLTTFKATYQEIQGLK